MKYNKTTGVIIIIMALVFLFYWLYISSMKASYFDGYFANGAFQLFNPLVRISLNQTPGVDFFVFHGLGSILVHLPLFYLFGLDLQASEVSRYFVSGFIQLFICVVLYFSLRKYNDLFKSIVFSSLFYIFVVVLLENMVFPNNAILGVRSALPILIGLTLLHTRSPYFVGFLAGLALFVSTEHGLASLIALSVYFAVLFYRTARMIFLVNAVLCVCSALLTLVSCLFVFANGEILSNLTYSFLSLPSDQFWYFGVDPNVFLPRDWIVLLSKRYLIFYALVVIGFFSTLLLLRRNSIFAFSSIYLFAYSIIALISQLGYLSAGNMQGSERALLLIIIFILSDVRNVNFANYFQIAALCFVITFGSYDFQRFSKKISEASAVEKGQFLSSYWIDHLAVVKRLAKDGPIWSTFSGLPEYSFNQNALSFDYIIHALGVKNRASYVDTFLNSNVAVVRLDNINTWSYGWWLISSNWSFYREVFKGYRLTHVDRMSSLWVPRSDISFHPLSPQTNLVVKNNCVDIHNSDAKGKVIELQVSYDLINPWLGFPVIGLTPRLMVSQVGGEGNYASLPPPSIYGNERILPIVILPKENIHLCFRVETFLPYVSLALNNVKIVEFPVDDTTLFYLSSSRVSSR